MSIVMLVKRLDQLEKQVADLTLENTQRLQDVYDLMEKVESLEEGEQAYVEKIAEMRQEINALTQTNKIEPSINTKNDHNGVGTA